MNFCFWLKLVGNAVAADVDAVDVDGLAVAVADDDVVAVAAAERNRLFIIEVRFLVCDSSRRIFASIRTLAKSSKCLPAAVVVVAAVDDEDVDNGGGG